MMIKKLIEEARNWGTLHKTIWEHSTTMEKVTLHCNGYYDLRIVYFDSTGGIKSESFVCAITSFKEKMKNMGWVRM